MVLINLPFMGQYIASHVISPFIKRESPSLMMIYNSQLINDYYFSLKGCTVRWLERTNMKKVLVFQMERYYLLTQSAKPYLACGLSDIFWFDNLKSCPPHFRHQKENWEEYSKYNVFLNQNIFHIKSVLLL